MDKYEPIVKKYYDSLEEGKILARKCDKCEAIMYPPMPVCQECSCMNTSWIELNPYAKLVELGSLNNNHIWPELKDYMPIRWGEVNLVDGPNLTVVILGVENPEELGGRLPVTVKAEIIQDNGFRTIAFRLVEPI